MSPAAGPLPPPEGQPAPEDDPPRADDAGSLFWWHETLTAADGEVHVAFTSVAAGNLATALGEPETSQANIGALERAMEIGPGELRLLTQVHSAEVCDAAAFSAAESPVGDAWVSGRGAEPLAIRVADCMPVMMLGRRPDGGVVTAGAHAGRPGLLAGVLENTVCAVRDAGAEQLTAWIGPSACGRCYEIPPSMVETIAADRPAIRSTTAWGTAALDLRAEAAVVLGALGADVVDVGGCTIEDRTLFSHRRSQAQGARQGRMAGLVWTSR